MLAISVGNPLLFNNPITSICSITLMTNPTLAPNVEGLSRSCLHCKIMKESIAGNDHLLVRLVEKVFAKEFHTWSTGKADNFRKR